MRQEWNNGYYLRRISLEINVVLLNHEGVNTSAATGQMMPTVKDLLGYPVDVKNGRKENIKVRFTLRNKGKAACLPVEIVPLLRMTVGQWRRLGFAGRNSEKMKRGRDQTRKRGRSQGQIGPVPQYLGNKQQPQSLRK